MTKKLCIYHGDCTDGFTAAWVVRNYYGEGHVELHKGVYGKDAPDVTGRDVIIVDFSYDRKTTIDICKQAKSVLILDHHKSAEANLRGLDGEFKNCKIVFDMDRSGAMITWDYFFPNEYERTCPDLVKYVQDRDIWKFELPRSREFTAAISSYEYTFKNWDALSEREASDICNEGESILRKHNKDIAEFIELNSYRRMTIAGFSVPVINIPYSFGSDACHILCKNEPFAAYYFDSGHDRKFGLRSDGANGEDVSKIAATFGGGGHKNASGFVLKDYNLDNKEL